MLEILLVYYLCKRIGAMVREKGHRAGWYQFFVVVAWFGGEFAGGFLVAFLMAVMNPGEEPGFGMVYLAALAGAVVSVGLVFFLANSLPDRRAAELAPDVYSPANPEWPRDTGNPYQPPST